jgi:hypothetical protein
MKRGGGLYVNNTANVTVSGVIFQNNAPSVERVSAIPFLTKRGGGGGLGMPAARSSMDLARRRRRTFAPAATKSIHRAPAAAARLRPAVLTAPIRAAAAAAS